MDDLTKALASLQLGDEPPRSRRRAWVASVPLVLIGAAGTILWWRPATLTATEVDTTTPRIERTGEAPSGSPLLTASGYVVARRKALVSANSQGRLLEDDFEIVAFGLVPDLHVPAGGICRPFLIVSVRYAVRTNGLSTNSPG